MATADVNLSEFGSDDGIIINGINFSDNLGVAVSSAGDINGDGFDDLIIGAPGADSNNNFDTGQSYVVFGDSDGFPPSLNPSDLDGAKGFVINGINNSDRSGQAVSSAGDINGDGFDDLIIGAPFADHSGNSDAGRSYVVFGGGNVGSKGELNLADLNGGNGFVIDGINSFDNLGRAVSNAGDINGDGFDDLIIGAPFADPNNTFDAGQVYVVFGSDSGFSPSLDPTELNGSNGFVINGANSSDNLGLSVSSAGDINGDGVADLVIGSPGADSIGNFDAGRSYVVFGNSTIGSAGNLNLTELNGVNGFVINGVNNSDRSGQAVSSAGDINGDGFDDLLIGAPFADPSGNSDAGQIYVVFGGGSDFEPTLNLSDLDGGDGFVINGVNSFDNLGFSVSSAGDINDDGFDDLLIGAPFADPKGNSNAGQSYVVFGGDNIGSGGSVNLAELNDSNGLIINGVSNFDNLGQAVSGAGDFNGDGADDLLIGAPFADPNSNSDAGQSYLLFGLPSLELIGTDGNDALTGGRGRDRIEGLDGDDILQGLGSSDLILGGSGDDLIAAGDGNDTVEGGSGNDIISGDQGNDILAGDRGRDTIFGGDGDDQISGGAGKDRILGEFGDDILKGGKGKDIIDGGEGNDLVFGGAKADWILGGTGDDDLLGEAGADTITGGFGDDLLNGGDGVDHLIGVDPSNPGVGLGFGAGEVDTLTGGAASDTFILGDENHVFYDDGNLFTRGESDFALITDFNAGEDFIQLKGAAELYTLDFFTSEMGTINADLIFDPGITARGEVIAILQDVSATLNITDPSFLFV